MMKKKVLALSLVVACGVSLLLSACSDPKKQDAPATKSTEVQAPNQANPSATQQSLPATGGTKCDSLLMAKCTDCHNTTRICEKLGKKSKARWQRTIDRMTERGAKLNAEDAAALLVCLDSGAKDLQNSCR